MKTGDLVTWRGASGHTVRARDETGYRYATGENGERFNITIETGDIAIVVENPSRHYGSPYALLRHVKSGHYLVNEIGSEHAFMPFEVPFAMDR